MKYILSAAVLFLFSSGAWGAKLQYYGTPVGTFQTTVHDVSGTVYVVDHQTLFVKNFSYDGTAPDAFFWYGSTGTTPSPNGKIIPVENTGNEKLRLYRGEDVILRMTNSSRVWDIKWLSVWCRQVEVDFGSFVFPASFRVPWTHNLGCFGLSGPIKHNVRSDMIYVKDSRTIEVKLFNYDGAAPDSYFVVGKGKDVKYDEQTSLILPNEFGSTEKLGKYELKDVMIRAPSGTNLADYSWFSVYCKSAVESLSHVKIPTHMRVPPNLDDLRGMNYGFFLGALDKTKEGVSGMVYVIDNKRLFIKDFSYSGQAPDTYFYFDTQGQPAATGKQINDEFGRAEALGAYENKNIVLTLPDRFTTDQIKWFSVWCKEAVVDLGHVIVNVDIVAPQAAKIGIITHRGHGVFSGEVTLLDTRTIRIENFQYSGGAPDTAFILGKGSNIVWNAATSVRLPDENGVIGNLASYNGKDIVIQAPAGVNVADFDWLSVYCISVRENFGDVMIPDNLDLPPSVLDLVGDQLPVLANCMSLDPKLNLHWEVNGEDITIELEGVLDPDAGYMAFGLSGEQDENEMENADVTVAYFEGAQPMAEDYFLYTKSQCSRGRGACPDANNDVSVIAGSRSGGISRIRYTRKLDTGDSEDKVYPTNSQHAVVWALGQMTAGPSRLVTRHHTRSDDDILLNFGRSPERQCGRLTVATGPTLTPWPIMKIADPKITTFNFKIGPSGGQRGFQGMTGIIGWGIAYYVNNLLIPELTVKRGVEYTFDIETGSDTTITAEYHPVYITTDDTGGWVNMNDEQRKGIQVFAGLTADGLPEPLAVGHLCEFDHKTTDQSEASETFDAFFQTLEETCKPGNKGRFTWTPDENTPDLVYYQCYQHRNLGWKINVVDDFP